MELRLRKLPEDLYEVLQAMAKRDGISMRVAAIMLMRLGQSVDTIAVQNRDKVRTKSGQSVQKFIPPTEAEANAEIEAKGYHFAGREFVAWNGSRGWRTKQGPMKDWRAAMVTWETRWKEKHQGNGQASMGTQEYDTSGNKAVVEAIKAGKGW